MKIVRKIAVAVVPILVLGLVGLLIQVLSEQDGGQGRGSLSPEETVEEFNRHILSGNIDSAGIYCTEQMSRHIGRLREAWGEIERRDSAVCSAAVRLLEGADIHISGTEKADNGRVLVHYRIVAKVQGYEAKAKVAELVEHRQHGEGASVWMIEKIRNGEED